MDFTMSCWQLCCMRETESDLDCGVKEREREIFIPHPTQAGV